MFPQIDSEVHKLTFGNLTGITETANNSVFETENVVANTHRRELDASRRVYRNYGTKTRIQRFQRNFVFQQSADYQVVEWEDERKSRVTFVPFYMEYSLKNVSFKPKNVSFSGF